jgi:hypothetical protein
MTRLWILLAGLAAIGGCSQSNAPEAAPSDTSAAVASPAAVATAAGAASDAAAEWVKATYGDDETLVYKSGSVDLDGDSIDELLVYPAGPMLCGSGGCNLVVLQKSGDGWTKVSESSVTQLPVGVLKTSTNGWRDLWVTTAGGGMPMRTMKLTFDGKRYPSNPTVAPAVAIDAPGMVVIAEGELTRIR